jgi:hypothetical protein
MKTREYLAIKRRIDDFELAESLTRTKLIQGARAGNATALACLRAVQPEASSGRDAQVRLVKPAGHEPDSGIGPREVGCSTRHSCSSCLSLGPRLYSPCDDGCSSPRRLRRPRPTAAPDAPVQAAATTSRVDANR